MFPATGIGDNLLLISPQQDALFSSHLIIEKGGSGMVYEIDTLLKHVQPLKMVVGVSCGLDYLHNSIGNQFRIVHRDVKSSKTSLIENWTSKIGELRIWEGV